MTASSSIGCYSTLPDYKISIGCENPIPTEDLGAVNHTFWYDGQTVVGQVYTLTGSVPLTQTSITTWPASEASHLVAYSVLHFVTFIHKPTDFPATATAGDWRLELEEALRLMLRLRLTPRLDCHRRQARGRLRASPFL